MVTTPYTVVARFRVRPDAVEDMRQLISNVTERSLGEDGCQIYHWSQGAEDPTLFLLYMEWRDKTCFDAHVTSPHVKRAEDRLEGEKMLVEPADEWHFDRL